MTTDSASVSTQARDRAVLSHLSSYVMLLGIPAPLGPLVAWLLWRDDPYVGDHAREALNFNLSFFIYGIVAAASIVVLVGLVALPVVAVAWFVLVIVAAVKASSGETYRYPATIRFLA